MTAVMSSRRIAEFAAAAVESAPLPSSLAELDAASRRRFEREAAALGDVTPEQRYLAVRAATIASAAEAAEMTALARAIRR